MTQMEMHGNRVGEHLLPSGFLNGVFNCRSPKPKYSTTWDVDVVLTCLKSLPDNEDLPFQLLPNMVAMLMSLANANRLSY